MIPLQIIMHAVLWHSVGNSAVSNAPTEIISHKLCMVEIGEQGDTWGDAPGFTIYGDTDKHNCPGGEM